MGCFGKKFHFELRKIYSQHIFESEKKFSTDLTHDVVFCATPSRASRLVLRYTIKQSKRIQFFELSNFLKQATNFIQSCRVSI